MKTCREEFKNGDADKSKVIPQLLPKYYEEQEGKTPCWECCCEDTCKCISKSMDEEGAMALLLGMFWFGGNNR